ncbi:trypsin-like serine protease [Pseudoalteromonas luteoviolacea]|uniref:trypsin-like serine protease n=1 Tax=Pseudoalteromonas luteoviolacea TaxID=43657 RepID=UPI001B3688F1|nr:trypsin-like serine protease [Pseudoalteromonas luteoviolacea]MBQ4835503.1 trypsin-like serine protease [Pseudoalteromonas luteoviolacea]
MLSKIQGVLLLATATLPILGHANDKLAPLQIASTQSEAQSKSGTSSAIVGGEEVTPNSYPFMGILEMWGTHRCGVSFIGGNKALTSNICAADFEDIDNRAARFFTVKFGGHDRNDPSQWQSYSVNRVVRHEGLHETHYYNNDIAILELDRPVENIAPIKLADYAVRASLAPGEDLKILGMGGENSTKMHEVDVPYVPSEICNDSDHYDGKLSDSMMCAGLAEGGKAFCGGGYGGPLIVRRNDEWVQLGVASWAEGCALPNRPDVFVDVSTFAYWTHTTLTGFGFNDELEMLYIPDLPSTQIQGSFKNTLGHSISTSDFYIEEPFRETLELTEQNCSNSTLEAGQECNFTVDTLDERKWGYFQIYLTLTAPKEQVYTGNGWFSKVTPADEDISEHMSIPASIRWYTESSIGDTWRTKVAESGEHILLSGDISQSEEQPDAPRSTHLLAEINDPLISEFSFDYFISSEMEYDSLTVYHNHIEILKDDGQSGTFKNVTVNLKEGTNLIFINYNRQRDDGSLGLDNVIIKNISTNYPNNEPTAVLAQTELNIRSEHDFVLDASQSADADGDKISYKWIDLADTETVLGNEAMLAITAEKVTQDTTKTYQVTVTDRLGASTSAQVEVNIAANQAPVIKFVQNEINVRSETEFTLDASQTTDPEGDAITYSWVKLPVQGEVVGDKASMTIKAEKALQNLTIAYQLTATDSFGASSTELMKVNISKNNAPIVTLTSETQSASPGDEVVIVASSTDPDGDDMVYSWEQNSGPDVTLSSDNTQLTFIAPAVTQDETLEFTLTVTDSFGLSHSQNASIVVKLPAAKVDEDKPEVETPDTTVQTPDTTVETPDSAAETPTQAVEKDNGSSGSFGIISLFMLSLVGFRRFMTK